MDLRKLRGKELVDMPGSTRRYHVPPPAARAISALLTLRGRVIAPILAGVRSLRMGRELAHWTRVDRDHESMCISTQELLREIVIETQAVAA